MSIQTCTYTNICFKIDYTETLLKLKYDMLSIEQLQSNCQNLLKHVENQSSKKGQSPLVKSGDLFYSIKLKICQVFDKKHLVATGKM